MSVNNRGQTVRSNSSKSSGLGDNEIIGVRLRLTGQAPYPSEHRGWQQTQNPAWMKQLVKLLMELLAIRLMRPLAIPLGCQRTTTKWLVITKQKTLGKSLVIAI